MKNTTTFALLLSLLMAASALAGDSAERPQPREGDYGVLSNSADGFAKQVGDTLYLMGGSGDHTGRFQSSVGVPGWNGWTSLDVTRATESHWHVSTYNGAATGAAPGPGNHVAYVGDATIPSCGGSDPVGGYGNNWRDWLDFYGTAPDPSSSTLVEISYYISHDVEVDFDWVLLQVERATGWEDVAVYTDVAENLFESHSVSVAVSDYVGSGRDQVHLRWAFESDVAYADSDCNYAGNGAAQIDDLEVRFDGTVVSYDDFESAGSGDVGNWSTVLAPGVGDFARIWTDLEDLDPCNSNYSAQVAFVDDGYVVPGTGGTPCISWCYGPDGYIVNNSGGLAGPDRHLNVQIVSPVLEWPGGSFDGAILYFDVYRHEELGAFSVWPGMFYVWNVRSVNTGNPADLESAEWVNRNFVQYGGPDYIRHREPVTDLMVPGRTHVQIALEVTEFGWVWGWEGSDGTPAPYFDNVAFKVFEFTGPGIATREIDIAQDAFPERGSIDYANPQINWCRFDMARDIGIESLVYDFGDSIIVDVTPVRAGSQLTVRPRMYYKLKTNPLFNPYRGTELGSPDAAGFITGYVEGDSARNNSGLPLEGRWFFDLPDTGQFYPGDKLHYYIWAQDVAGGVVQSSTLPADTTGFSNFRGDLIYDLADASIPANFSVSFLPSLHTFTPGDHPRILFWNDFANRGGQQEWHTALRNNGYQEGEDFDVYYTNGPSSGVSNGLGGAATPSLLSGYQTLLYSSGNLSATTISPAVEDGDKADDTALLSAWFEQGQKNALFTGDDLAYDLSQMAPNFLQNWLGIDFKVKSVRSSIENQTAPLVLATAANPVLAADNTRWVAYGGCPGINQFDGVDELGGTVALAEFASPAGYAGGYAYPAATHHVDATRGNQVVYLPYDLMYVRNDPNVESSTPLAARAKILRDVLVRFGQLPGSPATDVPQAAALGATNYPNPFNPTTTIKFTVPRTGDVSLRIYNVRGELVRTLLDEARYDAGTHPVVWEGTNENGGKVASGVYFYEVRANGQTVINKMALVK
ncbi:MAG: FlgD immunoglobulin-like domain containing protein [Candidatus Krumholzibacteriia bacterium]